MKQYTLLFSLLFSTVILNAQTINVEKSVVNFKISNMKWKTVEGTFTGMQGDVLFDINNLANASFNVCINPATVNTENEKRDDHLRGEDFFDVEQYPEICFTSTSIIKTSEGYITQGKLTMHGVTKPVEINFTYANKTFTGKVIVNRFDYKIGEDMKTFMVGEEAELEIICKLI